MAITALRAYNHEIEGMIDNGQLDEAVAHCRHILATFPKHIATYRLLGKAHLEQQRISDATDIFQRVLASIPDDFVANVGMSIIREDENNLDSAIWHMELAYEAQPSNVAIQDELRRLYGRRDGMQPPKVRLTRGALARMYSKGGLYDQAVAELRAAISEDPNRPDLQLLLAEMFFQAGQRVEAVETCANILKKIPFCLEANRILAVCLPEADGSETVRNYRQIVISMDPYYAFAGPDTVSSDQVPENAVSIERLDYTSGIQVAETPAQPNWATSLGISIEKPSDENIPDWLKSAEAPPTGQAGTSASPSVSPFIWDTQEVQNIITDTSKPEPEIPDWMKDAGWQPASGEAPKPSEEVKPAEPLAEAPQNETLEKAELPEWLQGIAPEGMLGEIKPVEQPGENTLSTPWLEQHQPGPSDSIIHWLEDTNPEKPKSRPAKEEAAAQLSEDEVPDWLKDLEPAQPSSTPAVEPASSMPAFTLDASSFVEQTQTTQGGGPVESPFEEAGEQVVLPAGSDSPAGSEEEIPDWLQQLAGDQPPAEAASMAAQEAQPAGSLPASAGAPIPGESQVSEVTPTVAEPALEQASAAAGEAESMVELPTEEAIAIAEQQPIPEEPAIAAQTEEMTTPTQLEGLPAMEVPALAEQPPAAGELVEAAMPAVEGTPPPEQPVVAEQPSTAETAPMEEGLPSTEIPPDAGQPPVEELPLAGQEPDSLAWLSQLAAEQGSQVESLPAAEGGEILPPEWVKLEAEPPGDESIEPVSAAPEAKAAPAEEIPAWIQGLGEEPAVEPASEPPAKGIPELEVAPNEELPAWLRELEEPEPEKSESVPATEGEEWKPDELPAWLKEITESEPASVAPVPADTPQAPEVLPAVLPPTPAEVPVVEEISSVELPAIPTVVPTAEIVPQAEVPAVLEMPTLEEVSAVDLPPVVTETPAAEVVAPSEPAAVVEAPGAVEVVAAEVPAAAVEAPTLAEVVPAEEPAAAVEAPAVEELAIPVTPAVIETPTAEEPAPAQVPVVSQIPFAEPVLPTEVLPVVEAPLAVQAPPSLTQPAPEWSEETTPPAGILREALEVPPAGMEAQVPVTLETDQPAPSLPSEAPLPGSQAGAAVEVTGELPEDTFKTFQAISQANQTTLGDARNAMSLGEPSQAVELYNKLIEQNYHLDEIIKDMQAGLFRFPVDVELWVTLGDAQLRVGDLPEALSAYTKAEALVR